MNMLRAQDINVKKVISIEISIHINKFNNSYNIMWTTHITFVFHFQCIYKSSKSNIFVDN